MINKKKRGMSGVIMTLLLILLVTTTIAGVLVWNRKLFSSLTSGSVECSEISFTIGDFCYTEQTVSGVIKDSLTFNIRNELANKNITGFFVLIDDNYGNTQTVSSLSSVQVAGF